MKHIKESIIGRKGTSIWPNPYGLTKKDAIGQIEGYPLEIITLALYETYLGRSHSDFDLRDLQRFGLACAFTWIDSKDGMIFWRNMCDKNFDMFYKKYTPESLRKRLEEK